MKQNFKGWTSVYSFTLRQATKGVGFKLVTALITILIMGLIIGVTVFTAKPEVKKKTEVSPIKTVYVLDNSGLKATDYRTSNPELSRKQYKNILFVVVTSGSREDIIKDAASDSKEAIAVFITKAGTGYELEAVIPAESTISKGPAEDLLGQMKTAFEANKLMQSGLTTLQLTTVMKPEVPSYTDIGDKSNTIAYVIKMVAPMIFSFMLYMMLLLHGITVSKSVSTEKTSKLMETLLTSIHPYALIAGKILAITTMAILQFVTWIIAAFVGLFGGNAIAHSLYPDYHNSVISLFNYVKENIGNTAFTPAAIIMAIIFFCIGFLFYCVIAGLAGCMVSKPEDAAATQQIYMMPVVISFLITYMAPLAGNDSLIRIARYIPFTAPFCVPSDLITGTIGLGQGLLTLVVLIAFTLLTIMLSGRIYRGLILYNGQKVSLKMIGNILKSNK